MTFGDKLNNGSDQYGPRIPREATALMAALQVRGSSDTLLHELTDHDWSSLLGFCELAHLTLPLARVATNQFPTWVADRLETNAAYNALRFERVKKTYREAANALNGVGVDHVVIKGFSQVPDYVNEPRWRAQSDLDFFCPAEMIEPARVALEAIGYKAEQRSDYRRADHIPTLVRPGPWRWRGNHFDPEMPLSIELHFCLWNEAASMFSIPEVQDFWNRRTVRVVDGLYFPCLSKVDQLGYISLHIVRNLLSGEWIVHHVRELAVFLQNHAGDDAFWQAWTDIHDKSLRSIEAIAFYYAQAWFGCELHKEVGQQIAKLLPVQQRWLRRFKWSALECMFYPRRDSIWLHMSFLQSGKVKRALVKRHFFPVKVSSIDSPNVEVRNRRPVGKPGDSRYLRYCRFLIARCAHYSRFTMITLLRGLRWRMESRSFSMKVWMFLLACFFLTSACLLTSSFSTYF